MTREETKMWLENLKKDIGQPQHQALWHYAEVIDMVIEAVEVVSCKDCINRSICAKTINMTRTESNSITMWAQPVDYCSYGRRKDQNNE